MLKSFWLVSLLLLSLRCYADTIYNAASDYSSTQNSNGVWSYGYGGVPPYFGVMKLDYNVSIGPTTTTWADSTGTGGFQPIIGHNSNSAVLPDSGIYIPSTELVMHPGNSDALPATLVFTAPYTGTYDMSGYFTRRDPTASGTGVSVSIYDGSTPLFGSQLQPSSFGTFYDFDVTQKLVAGENVFFNVSQINSYFGDTTGLSLQVLGKPAVTPEPPSVVLLGTGLLAFAGIARRLAHR